MPSLIRLFIALASSAFLVHVPTAAAFAQPASVRHIFLIQNSGWMLAYSTDPAAKKKYQDFIADFVNAAAPTGQPVIIADFSTASQVKDGNSPGILASGSASPELTQKAISRLTPPPTKLGSTSEFVDSDYSEALRRTTERPDLANSRPAVIWMITNNMYAPASTQGKLDDTVKDLTTSFNKTLRSDDNVVLLFAIIKLLAATRPPERGPQFEGRGLVVYGMAYGGGAIGPMKAAVAAVEQTKHFDSRSARLKPLEVSPLTYTPTSILTDDIDFSYDDSGRIVFSNVASGVPTTIRIQGTLASNYFPQVIDSADLRMSWSSDQDIESVQGFKAQLSKDHLERLRPADKLEGVELTLQLPAIDRPAGLGGLLTEETRIDGSVRFTISKVTLEIDDDFKDRMKPIFGSDRWRGVFLDGFRVNEATTVLPITIVVAHSSWPLYGAILGVAALIAGLIAIAWLATRERRFPILVGGETRTVGVKPFSRVEVRDRAGKPALRLTGRMLGSPRIERLAPATATAAPAKPSGPRIPPR